MNAAILAELVAIETAAARMSEDLREVRDRLGRLGATSIDLGRHMAALDGRLARIEAGLDRIDGRLGGRSGA